MSGRGHNEGRVTSGRGRGGGRHPAGGRHAQEGKRAVHLPNSLESNIGRFGYDSEGVKQLIRSADGKYFLPEVWKTMELWCGKNDCIDIQPMFSSLGDGFYPDYRDEVEVDDERYNGGDLRYRDMKQLEIKAKASKLEKVKSQEAKVYTKLWSLIDEQMRTVLLADRDIDFVMAERRPDFLRVSIVEAVNSSVAYSSVDRVERLREEYTSFAMPHQLTSLASYLDRWMDLDARMTDAGIIYSDAEKANRFLKGLSLRFSDLQARILEETPRPVNVMAAYQRAQVWEEAQIKIYGTAGTKMSADFAAYSLQREYHERNGALKGGRGGRASGRSRNAGRGRGYEKPAAQEDEVKDSDGNHPRKKPRASGKNRFTDKGEPICNVCDGKGHMSYECPSVGRIAVLLAATSYGNDNFILLDNGAEGSMFRNGNLLGNLKPCVQSSMTGAVGSKSLSKTKEGWFHGLLVGYSPKINLNILSEIEMKQQFELFTVDDWGTRAVHREDGTILDFTLRGGKTQYLDYDNPVQLDDSSFFNLYNACMINKIKKLSVVYPAKDLEIFATRIHTEREVCDETHTGTPTQTVCATVEENKQLFSKREVEKAELARRFVKNSGYRSVDSIKESIGRMLNVPVTQSDLRNQRVIFGPHPEELKGRMRDRSAPVVSPEYLPKLLRRDVSLHIDLMEILGKHFVIGMVKPVGLGIVHDTKSKGTKSLLEAILVIINTLSSLNMIVNEVVYDPEKSLVRACGMLHGIQRTEVGAGEHVVNAENLIQHIKNICRCVIAGLPWKMPISLVSSLVKYAMRRRNSFITSSVGEIPLEMVNGAKLDFKKEFCLGFGDRCEVYVKPIKTSTMEERTVSAIALYPVGRSGAWRFLDLNTGSMRTRRRHVLLPTDDVTIRLMNEKYMRETANNLVRRQEIEEIIQEEVAQNHDVVVHEEDVPAVVEANRNLHVGEHDEDEDEGDIHNADDMENAEEENMDMNIELPVGATVDAVNQGVSDRTVNMACIAMVKRKAYIANIKPFMALKHKGTKKSIQKVMRDKSPEGLAAMEAARKEIRQIDEKGVWVPVDHKTLSKGEYRKIIRTFMFIVNKYKPSGDLDKVKARLVAMGNLQNLGDIKMDVSAPTVSSSSVLTVVAIAAMEGRHVMTCDIGGAFLHAEIPKDISIRVVLDKINAMLLCQIRPEYEQFRMPDGGMVLQLNRALYGLVQSARLWYNRFSKVLKDHSFLPNAVDGCVWNEGVGDNQITVMFHVDDLAVTCQDIKKIKNLESILILEFGKDNINCQYGDVHDYLGMHFEFERAKKSVVVSMHGYTETILSFAEVKNEERAKTPANARLFDIDENAEKLNVEDAKKFHSIVQAMSYMSQRVRWDIMLAVNFLKTRVQSPDVYDWKKLRRILAYLNDTKDLKLRLGITIPIRVDGSIDASHAVYQNARSQGGCAISLGLGVIKGRSHKLNLNTKSSSESELVAASDNVGEVVHAREFLRGQGYDTKPAIFRQDNQSTIHMINKGQPDSVRTRHINTRFYFIHDRVKNGEIELMYAPTDEMVADFFTKPLQGALFLKLRDKLLGNVAFA